MDPTASKNSQGVRKGLTPVPEISLSKRVGCFLIDYFLLVGFVTALTGLLSVKTQWNFSTHLLFPLFLLPLANYLLHRFVGTTPGLYAFGLEKRTPSGAKALRLYDWLFLLQTCVTKDPPTVISRVVFLFASTLFFLGTSTFLWMRDPTLRPYSLSSVALFAPEHNEKNRTEKEWVPLPFFYTTGAFPLQLPGLAAASANPQNKELSVEFDLPYAKGPPSRFLGKIVMLWRELDSRLSLTGPLTLPAPGTPAELRDCFQHWFGGGLGCMNARRGLWKSAVIPALEGRTVEKNRWFTVENPLLNEGERPQGIYLRTRPERGRIRDLYFVIGPKMAMQGFLLDRPERAEGDAATSALEKIIGSLRVSSDLAAPRAFLDPKLAALRIGPKSSISELIAAEGHLLAKVSIEPKKSESFYHLSGLAITLYRKARNEGRIELAASSKRIVKSALQFVRDVDPASKRIPEMERFQTEVEAK